MPDVSTPMSLTVPGGTAPEADEARPTILLVEDEALVAMVLEDVLSVAGYRILACVSDGPSALAAAAAAPAGPTGLRAAVVDLWLGGGMTGREVISRLREARPGLPVVAVTGHGPGDPKADLRGLGGPTRRLGKPFDLADLLVRLSVVIAAQDDAARTGGLGAVPRRRSADGADAA